ncbi:arginyltransferase [Desulforhopalus singaporensis]|uniref:Arginine-tRNA-protein transferase n=1 Tax=Desulforhopalus singaporensis TaxID=91360 RepID=A0A1H0TFZ4_9BACT|nr:arginyltransferase [Desulforhopalus singaporensis]SDP52751.1 arginine-tRNA-protein transferase [Desulforhopalus singaporensis]
MKELPLSYDLRCAREFAMLKARVDHLFVDIDIACPYEVGTVATFHQATFAPLSERAMELFLSAGYRRNGNCLYCMSCSSCSSCIPVRLHSSTFRPNRNQKRTAARNSDVSQEILPLAPDGEELELCDHFLKKRYPGENNSATGYFRDFFLNNIVTSARVQYRIDTRLVGTSIIDIGYNWLNAVYFYFDPEESRRSLGTFNILNLVELCVEWDIEYLYLGYLINEISAMSYKANFRPNYTCVDGIWQSNS